MFRDAIIETQMRKFAARMENGSETSQYGLSTANVSIAVLDDYEKAFDYIRGNLWLEMFDGVGVNTAVLLLQLHVGSGNALHDILKFLYLAENQNEGAEQKFSSFDNASHEIIRWLENSGDMRIAEKLSYAMLNYYMNWNEQNAGHIEGLKSGCQVGFDFERIAPSMSDAEIEKYNSCLEAGSVYRLRANSELDSENAIFPENEPDADPGGDAAAGAGKDWVKMLAAFCAGFAAGKIAGGRREKP